MKIKNVVAAVMAMGIVSAASASVVFENGTDGNFLGGNNPFTYEVATQVFSVASAITFNSLTYDAYTVAGNTVPVTNVFAEILASDGSTVISTGNYSVANTQIIGGDGYYGYTDYTINMPAITLAAGSYYLGLQVFPQQWNEHWSIPSDAIAGPGSDGVSHYFRLEDVNAVPEPMTTVLFGLGLLAMVALRRKSRQ